MGLLKGRFQSLKEIRVQLNDSRHHMIVIMWARVCIILHNLIICIEGDNFDEIWRDGLMQAGLDCERCIVFDADEEGELRVGDTLEWVW